MSRSPFDDDWIPAQEKKPEIIDLRSIAYGPRGYKLKNKSKFAAKDGDGEAMEIDGSNVVRLGNATNQTIGLGTGKVRR